MLCRGRVRVGGGGVALLQLPKKLRGVRELAHPGGRRGEGEGAWGARMLVLGARGPVPLLWDVPQQRAQAQMPAEGAVFRPCFSSPDVSGVPLVTL
jgi:hypothetical protein